VALDLHDIQGNIVKAYPRLGLPVARYVFLRVRHIQPGMRFVDSLIPHVTCAAPWHENAGAEFEQPPEVTLNVAFTFHGLRRLGLPSARSEERR